MLTGFKNRAVQQKTQEEQKKIDANHHFMLKLLTEALETAILDNDFRVHIEGDPFRVEFKFPDKETLQSIQHLLNGKRIVAQESKVMNAEILVHTFKIAPALTQIVEVLYRPISRPRL